AALGQPTLQRHLAAFETDLVKTAGTALLALVATARGLAQARTDAAADAAARLLAAVCRLDLVQFHHSTFTRYATLLILPRAAGVSSSVRVLVSLRRPRPRTVARWSSRVPATLLTSWTVRVVFLSVIGVLRGRSVEDVFDRLAALGGHLGRRRRALEGVE